MLLLDDKSSSSRHIAPRREHGSPACPHTARALRSAPLQTIAGNNPGIPQNAAPNPNQAQVAPALEGRCYHQRFSTDGDGTVVVDHVELERPKASTRAIAARQTTGSPMARLLRAPTAERAIGTGRVSLGGFL